MEYLEFELRIGPGGPQGYPATVGHSPGEGEPSALIQVPLGDAAFSARLNEVARLRALDVAARRISPAGRSEVRTAARTSDDGPAEGGTLDADPQRLGHELFRALFPPDLERCFINSLKKARAENKGLRVRLRIEAPELSALPWEFLYDPSRGDHVCLDVLTPVTRYIELDQAQGSLLVPPPLRVLAMIASPSNLAELDVAKERQTITDAVAHLVEGGDVEVEWLTGGTWRELQSAMAAGPWHVLHFIGHGGFDERTGEGLIALVDDVGKSRELRATEVARLLAGHLSLRLVVLNACEGARASDVSLFSSVGATLTRKDIPAVVSMQYPITDLAALEFSRAFYEFLARGAPIDVAVTEARKAISLALPGTAEWATPVLHMRCANGHLFKIDVGKALFDPPPSKSAGAMQPLVTVPSTTTTPADPQTLLPPRVSTRSLAPDTVRSGLLLLLRKVKQFWIEGVLDRSLFRAALIDLGLEMASDEVDNPWGAVLERPGLDGEALRPDQSIRAVLEEVGNSLLILGTPGSGKTTTLLGLARDLVAQAEEDVNRAVPVVFNLSSYTDRSATLAEWLVDELASKYQIPKVIARTWIADNRIMPLLDGLDEVRPELQVACVDAINAFMADAATVGTVICCRLKEYAALPTRLQLNGAVRLQPLQDSQIDAYLDAGAGRLTALRKVLALDSTLRIEARSPLMLSLMSRAYQDLSVDAVLREGADTTDTRRSHIMEAYLARMFRRAEAGAPRG